MTTSTDVKRQRAMIVERVRLPDQPAAGRYNKLGKKDPKGNVFIVILGITVHAWAVFDDDVWPQQSAAMIFENLPGTGILNVVISQWIKGGSGNLGENFNQPNVGEAVLLLVSRERMEGAVKVVGTNSSQAEVAVAAAVLYIPAGKEPKP